MPDQSKAVTNRGVGFPGPRRKDSSLPWSSWTLLIRKKDGIPYKKKDGRKSNALFEKEKSLTKNKNQSQALPGLYDAGLLYKPHIIGIYLTFHVSETDPIKYLTFSMILSILGIRGILLNRRNIPIMSMPIESMLLAVNSNFLVFSVSLDDMMGQSFASLVPTVAAAESAIGSAIFVITFRVRGTIAVESINCIQG